MVIFEPAMCCDTGVCGPSVDQELLRLSTVLNNLRENGVLVERYNLTNNPQIFVDNRTIHSILNQEGVEALPVTMVDGEVVKKQAYPSNEEICQHLNLSTSYLQAKFNVIADDCGCNDGSCC